MVWRRPELSTSHWSACFHTLPAHAFTQVDAQGLDLAVVESASPEQLAKVRSIQLGDAEAQRMLDHWPMAA